MRFDVTSSHASDALSLTELDLYHALMEYRAAAGLDPIPLSAALTATAGRHAADTLWNIWGENKALAKGANLHSWSDAPYYADHSAPETMWNAPERIGTGYDGAGFEISAAGYDGILAALAGWQGSAGHDQVILNQGVWSASGWNAIGIGVEIDPSVPTYGGRIYHVWFGRESDPDAPAAIAGGDRADRIEGTAFGDRIVGGGGSDTLSGGAGRDRLLGGAGQDDIGGGGGRDRLNGGAGDDALKGGAGRDVFVFRGRDFGTDTVEDLSREDILRLRAPGEAETRAELRAALSQEGGDTVYDHGGDGRNVIVLEDVRLSQLDLSLFDLG